MAKIMAHCFKCGIIFPSGIRIEGNSSGSLQNNFSSCPKCGSMARVQEGYFEIVDGIIKHFQLCNFQEHQLFILKKSVEETISAGKSVEESMEVISKEAPELKSILSLLPKTREQFYSFLTLILTIITMLLNQCNKVEQPEINVNNVIIEYNNKVSAPTYNNPFVKEVAPGSTIKVGPYEQCPCGSGKKYKFCDCHKKK